MLALLPIFSAIKTVTSYDETGVTMNDLSDRKINKSAVETIGAFTFCERRAALPSRPGSWVVVQISLLSSSLGIPRSTLGTGERC